MDHELAIWSLLSGSFLHLQFKGIFSASGFRENGLQLLSNYSMPDTKILKVWPLQPLVWLVLRKVSWGESTIHCWPRIIPYAINILMAVCCSCYDSSWNNSVKSSNRTHLWSKVDTIHIYMEQQVYKLFCVFNRLDLFSLLFILCLQKTSICKQEH